jgi:hypothetical protein
MKSLNISYGMPTLNAREAGHCPLRNKRRALGGLFSWQSSGYVLGCLLAASCVGAGTALLRAQDHPAADTPLYLPPIDPALAGERFDPKTIAGQPGFFRVGRSLTGHWWFLDPNGSPFFYRGVTSVSRGDDLVHPRPYTQSVLNQYGPDPAAFRDATFARLRSWGFNALGAWSNKELWDQGMPYTIILNFSDGGPQIDEDGLPDVFDPAWQHHIDDIAKKLVEPERNSKALVGYFTDNELGWDGAPPGGLNLATDALDPNHSPTLLQLSLSQAPGRPVYQEAWRFVLARHGGSLQKVAAAWKVPLASQAAVQSLTHNKSALRSAEYLKDDAAFQGEFAHRYFQLTAEAIRKYDPNHLILGCRFGGPPSDAELAEVKRPWVDVVSANNYRFEMRDRMSLYFRATGLPVLNTEFSWGHGVFSQRPLPKEDPRGATPLQRMLVNGQAALEDSFRLPGLVGYTWYRWPDKVDFVPPITYGLVTIHNQPNSASTDLLTRINACSEQIAVTGWCGSDGRNLATSPIDDRSSQGVPAPQGGVSVLPEGRPDPEGFLSRKELMLRSLASEDANYFERIKPVPDPNKYALPTVLAKLEEKTDQAAAYAYLARHTDEMYHFSVVGLARLLPMFGGQLPPTTLKQIEHNISATATWTADGTENHKLMWLTSGVVLSDQLPQLDFYGGPSQWRRKQLLEPIRLYVKRLYQVGQGEWDSSTYETFAVQEFVNLYDFSHDPLARSLAAAALDWYSTALALKYFHGTLAGPERRGFDHGTLGSNAALTGWLWWGDSSRPATAADFTGPTALWGRYSIYPALSNYRPHPALFNLARKTYPFQGHETKPDYSMKRPAESYGTFVNTRNYFLGSAEVGARGLAEGENQITPWKLVARGVNENYTFTSLNPFHDPDEGKSPYDQVAQYKSTLIQMTAVPAGAEGEIERLREEAAQRASGDDRVLGHILREATFWMPYGLKPLEDGGWFFIAANRTWIALHPLTSNATLKPADGNSRQESIVAAGSVTGFVVQVADAESFPTFQAFRDAITKRVTVDLSDLDHRHVIVKNFEGERLDFTFNGFGTWPNFLVDGTITPMDPSKVYDLPPVQQEGGRLTVRDESGEGFEWDFTGDWPYYTELQGAGRDAH